MKGLLNRLSNKLTRDSLSRIQKVLVRSHLDYSDIVYDKSKKWILHGQVRKVQCKACLAITSVIQGKSRERLNKELGLESLSDIAKMGQ